MAPAEPHTPTRPPDCLTVVADIVSRRLDTLLQTEADRWAAVDPDLHDPLEALRRLVANGGKRLRPAFCTWAYVAGGGVETDPVVVDAGAAIELLHAFALAHDDVMDQSPSRRGHPTTHVEFADRHTQEGWAGDAGHFGEAVAILVGDLAYAYADKMMGAPEPAVAEIWQELRVEVNIGQYLDVLAAAVGAADGTKARRIVEYKTGRYSVVRPLHLGLRLAGANAVLDEPFTAYGHPVGTAFQLRDDVLGAFGDSALTGKPVGDDLREGKPTPLLAAARDRATPSQAVVLEQVGNPEIAEQDLTAIQAVMVESGALAAIEDEIASLTTAAIETISSAPIDARSRDALIDLATYVADRPN